MFLGGNFDHSGASPRHHDEWRKHHEPAPSTVDRTQAGEETHRRQPNCQELIRVPQWCGAGRHRQSAVSKGLLNDADIVAVVASPSNTVEVSSNQVHIFWASLHGL